VLPDWFVIFVRFMGKERLRSATGDKGHDMQTQRWTG